MRIVIVGLGVIGGGYAMALKEAGYTEVYGIDKSKETLKKAKALGIIKEGYEDEQEIVQKADLIVLAIYPNLVKNFIINNKEHFKDGAVITDVTGIKQLFINEIIEILPENIDFVFAHPMAGREKKGIDYATNTVFKGANFLITVIDRNKDENLDLIENLAYKMGFKHVKRICPKYHDEMIAFTSQLPHALAVALINSDVEGRNTGEFIGDSYRDLTRIANINESLWSQLFLGNKENLLEAINNFEKELDKIKLSLESDDKENLEQLFIKSSIRREKL
ncbi:MULTISPECIES: prephenate dehydrogenase [unclassified Clostridium]|uniref:prephenate dehydrogenase n=1 Tax=Clostridium TaxID=1485 RepID=UPI001C8CABE0|nr:MULTISPECIES: prephenate dehydrogenase [unclassified Clostridium]MBX9138565.1 prephenate dehydrogenase [Clostridium sp. K12(2020)]MBX9144898.1 prephenate dehydrogenase [Clostridium sp. K13]MDU2291808.1 prephenate dehydrogenase [Clostridium celatum]MDU4326984.1 prephenate dehydrogenase [Clostridium celatum]